jgi:ketosteroid isomerase-like protein
VRRKRESHHKCLKGIILNIEAEREKLRGLQAVFQKAVKENTMDVMRPHCSPHFSFVSFTDRSFKDFESFFQRWQITREEMVGKEGAFETDLRPEPSLFFGDIAVCQGKSLNKMKNRKGTDFEFTSNWTVIFKKEDSNWKVVRAHNSLDPFANPMLIDGVKRKIVMIAAVTGIVGIALGLVLSRLVGL